MKLHFEDNLDYQKAAIEAVANLFRGQEINRTEFTVSASKQSSYLESTLGIGNRLQLLDDELLENLRAIQFKNGLRPSEILASGDFTVEMETGTGKTYVYLRSIFELNKRYGFTKFMIVVPSVAIKEGTYKTLQITREHFENLYPSAKGYEYFLYDSSKLGQGRNYATSADIQIMVVTVGAINKKESITSTRTVKRPAEKNRLTWCARQTPSSSSMRRNGAESRVKGLDRKQLINICTFVVIVLK